MSENKKEPRNKLTIKIRLVIVTLTFTKSW